MINYNNYCLPVQSSSKSSLLLGFFGPSIGNIILRLLSRWLLMLAIPLSSLPIFLRIGRVRVFIFVGILHDLLHVWDGHERFLLGRAVLIVRLLDLVAARLVFETVIWGLIIVNILHLFNKFGFISLFGLLVVWLGIGDTVGFLSVTRAHTFSIYSWAVRVHNMLVAKELNNLGDASDLVALLNWVCLYYFNTVGNQLLQFGDDDWANALDQLLHLI